MAKWEYLRKFGIDFPSRNSYIFKYRWFSPSLKADFRSLQTLSTKGQIVNILGFVGPNSLCPNYSALLWRHENSLSQYGNELVWLYSNKTLFTKAGGGLDLAHEP